MNAIVCTKYGSPRDLQLEEVPKPVPGPGEVLVKVRAAAVNDYDWSLVQGKPRIYRLFFGLFKPKNPIPGMELAGTIEALGENANRFQPGDEVHGDTSDHGFGAFAEYICINEAALNRKPAGMSFAEAASISHASLLALQGLRDVGKIQDGSRILINGAGGGVGTFGLQIAKLHGAEVTGVDTGHKLGMMKSLGFDHVIDYKQEDFTKNGRRYDLILDAKTNRSPFAYTRSLESGGMYVTVGGTPGRLFQTLCLGPLISLFTKKKLRILALKPNQGLEEMNKLFEAGKLKCIIDGPYELKDVPRLIQYFGEGRHAGKVIISMPADAS